MAIRCSTFCPSAKYVQVYPPFNNIQNANNNYLYDTQYDEVKFRCSCYDGTVNILFPCFDLIFPYRGLTAGVVSLGVSNIIHPPPPPPPDTWSIYSDYSYDAQTEVTGLSGWTPSTCPGSCGVKLFYNCCNPSGTFQSFVQVYAHVDKEVHLVNRSNNILFGLVINKTQDMFSRLDEMPQYASSI